MREKVVCNASPLIFLAKLNRLDLLLIYELIIPSQVNTEIQKVIRHKRPDAQQITAYFKANGIEPVKVSLLKDLPNALGAGERAVISLAVKENIKKVFIDEAKARTVARFKGLEPKGTLGILWDAFKAGDLNRDDLETSVLELVQKGYRIKEEVLIEFLK